VSFSVHFVSEGQITLPPTVLIGRVMTERSVSLLFSGEMGNDDCDALSPVKE
jgi:hypothetical protein